jgi:hypothetical protein
MRRKRAKLQGAFVHGFGRPLHPHRIVTAGPRHGQRSAARFHAHRRIEQAARDPCDRRRAGTGAAGERLAGAALPHSQRDAMAIGYLHVAGVDAVGEARMALEPRSLRRDGRRCNVGNHLDRVRIAHRHDGELERLAVELDALEGRPARCAHVDAHFAVGFQARRDAAAERIDADVALGGQAPAVHELHEAARAVAALLDLAAVGVEDAVAEIDVGRPALHHEDLVAADAEVAVGEPLELRAREREGLAGAVDDDEVVAGALHLGELELHPIAAWMRAQMRSTPASSRSGLMGSESTACAAASEAGRDRLRFDSA